MLCKHSLCTLFSNLHLVMKLINIHQRYNFFLFYLRENGSKHIYSEVYIALLLKLVLSEVFAIYTLISWVSHDVIFRTVSIQQQGSVTVAHPKGVSDDICEPLTLNITTIF